MNPSNLLGPWLALLLTAISGVAQTAGGEWQLTNSPISKWLYDNGNFSRDGRRLAFNRGVPTFDAEGRHDKGAGVQDFPDADGDGVAEGLQ